MPITFQIMDCICIVSGVAIAQNLKKKKIVKLQRNEASQM